jgi:hypothetical protein
MTEAISTALTSTMASQNERKIFRKSVRTSNSPASRYSVSATT